MAFSYAQVYPGISHHGESFIGTHFMRVVLYAQILKRKFLLVYGSRREQGGLNSLLEP